MPAPRGNAWGWMVAVAAAALITIGGVAGRSSAFNTPLRSEHAKPAVVPVPADMMVVVTVTARHFMLPVAGLFTTKRTCARLRPVRRFAKAMRRACAV